MSFNIVEIDNSCLDVRVLQSSIGKRKYSKYMTDFDSHYEYCNVYSYILMKQYNFDSTKNQLNSIVIKLSNDHILKLDIDNITIFESNLNSLENNMKNYFDKNSEIIPISFLNNSGYFLELKLGDVYASNVSIYQKRRTGTGNLTIESVIISFTEEVDI